MARVIPILLVGRFARGLVRCGSVEMFWHCRRPRSREPPRDESRVAAVVVVGNNFSYLRRNVEFDTGLASNVSEHTLPSGGIRLGLMRIELSKGPLAPSERVHSSVIRVGILSFHQHQTPPGAPRSGNR